MHRDTILCEAREKGKEGESARVRECAIFKNAGVHYCSKFRLPSQDPPRLRFRKNLPHVSDVATLRRDKLNPKKSIFSWILHLFRDIMGIRDHHLPLCRNRGARVRELCETDDPRFSILRIIYYPLLFTTCPPETVERARTKSFLLDCPGNYTVISLTSVQTGLANTNAGRCIVDSQGLYTDLLIYPLIIRQCGRLAGILRNAE